MRAQGSAAGAQTVGLCSAAAVDAVSPYVSNAPAPLPASKSSKAQQAPGLLLEVQGGQGEVSGFGKAAAMGLWEGPHCGEGNGQSWGSSGTHAPLCA